MRGPVGDYNVFAMQVASVLGEFNVYRSPALNAGHGDYFYFFDFITCFTHPQASHVQLYSGLTYEATTTKFGIQEIYCRNCTAIRVASVAGTHCVFWGQAAPP